MNFKEFDKETESPQWQAIFYRAEEVAEKGEFAQAKESIWYDIPLTVANLHIIAAKAKELGFDSFEIVVEQRFITRYTVEG